MTGVKNSKSTFLEAVAVLAIPAVIYLMGYIYWREYFSCFDIDLAKINLPIYKVMVGATPGVYAVVLAALLIYFFGKAARTNAGYKLSIATGLLILLLVFLESLLVLAWQPKPKWFIPTSIAAISLLLILLSLSLLKIEKPPFLVKPRNFMRLPRQVDLPFVGIGLVGASFVLFFMLEDFSRTKGKDQADGILKSQKCSFVRFRFGSDMNFHLPDSLILIESSESHYFVFSRMEVADGKPRRVFAINKNSVSYVEIRSPEEHESAKHKGPAQPGLPD
jgi:hypothetical protein